MSQKYWNIYSRHTKTWISHVTSILYGQMYTKVFIQELGIWVDQCPGTSTCTRMRIWGFRNFRSCERRFYEILLWAERKLRNLLNIHTNQEVQEQSLLAQFFFRFHDLFFFFILRKNSIDFFLQFSSIYLSISKLLQFSLSFSDLL